jgi:DNA-directed RNA polymerase specialized sigma24 family protein
VPKSSPGPAVKTNITIEALSDQYLQRVWQYAYYWVKNSGIAEELTIAEIKTAAKGYRSGGTDPENFQFCLFGAACQAVTDYLCRKSGKRTGLKFSLSALVTGRSGARVIKFREYDDIAADKDNLTHQEKEVISLKLVAGLNAHCISRILGLSELDTGVILFQALSKLSIESKL